MEVNYNETKNKIFFRLIIQERIRTMIQFKKQRKSVSQLKSKRFVFCSVDGAMESTATKTPKEKENISQVNTTVDLFNSP